MCIFIFQYLIFRYYSYHQYRYITTALFGTLYLLNDKPMQLTAQSFLIFEDILRP